MDFDHPLLLIPKAPPVASIICCRCWQLDWSLQTWEGALSPANSPPGAGMESSLLGKCDRGYPENGQQGWVEQFVSGGAHQHHIPWVQRVALALAACCCTVKGFSTGEG